MPRLESMEPPTPGEDASPAGDSDPGNPDESAVFKIPGLISDFKSSLSSYFAPTSAKTRISRGDQFTVKARRLILSGDIAYLIDWESPPSSTASSWPAEERSCCEYSLPVTQKWPVQPKPHHGEVETYLNVSTFVTNNKNSRLEISADSRCSWITQLSWSFVPHTHRPTMFIF